MSFYKTCSPEELDNLKSQFLIDNWSYSKVSSFSRNEKAFEMVYIFGIYSKDSATSIAGKAYHRALEFYFIKLKEGVTIDLVTMEREAFAFIELIEANSWRLGKTTPTVDECIAKATATVTALLKNFYAEKGIYEAEIEEILFVELPFEEFLTVNGVDIPMSCKGRIDLGIRTKSGKIAIIDHKSKSTYTDDSEIALSIGRQAITYVLGYEAISPNKVDEVWFVENKYSANKDKSPQLRQFKLTIDANTRKLYEALLYEPLRRMVSAVNDPDYVYLINDSDNFVDRAELYEFWAKTLIAEVEEFNVDISKQEMVSQRLKKIRDSSITSINPNIIKNFKQNAATFIQYDLSKTNMTPEEKIEHVLRSFGTIVKVAHTLQGHSSCTTLLEVSAGVKIASIASHRLDVANALDVSNVRVSSNLVMYEGRSFLGIEYAKKRESNLLFESKDLIGKKIPLGKDNFQQTIVWDLENHSTPHMLVCGATGSGKSVFVDSTLNYATLAGVREIVIFDPKYEFTRYAGLPGIEVFNEITDIETMMAMLVEEMNRRVRNGQSNLTMVIFDEFADALSQSRKGKELMRYENQMVETTRGFKTEKVLLGEDKSLEENLKVLLQKGRSSGFRIIAATQRASTKVITGDAKVNFPIQVCFRVPKEIDSRVVIDEPGAESLAGMGDGLLRSPEYSNIVRFQAYYKPN